MSLSVPLLHHRLKVVDVHPVEKANSRFAGKAVFTPDEAADAKENDIYMFIQAGFPKFSWKDSHCVELMWRIVCIDSSQLAVAKGSGWV